MDLENKFYDSLADHYHLIFGNWDDSIKNQGRVLAALLGSPQDVGKILDCACGIGTQSFALFELGYQIEGSDLSEAEIKRAQAESEKRGHSRLNFRVDDMRSLITAPTNEFGAVLCLDNSIPHLDNDEEILSALSAMHRALLNRGKLLLSLRDYGPLMASRAASTPPVFYKDGGRDNGSRRIIHQIWDWLDERRYKVHLFITREVETGDEKTWQTKHFVGSYRAITPDELAVLVERAGFREVRICNSAETGFYQPIVSAEKAG